MLYTKVGIDYKYASRGRLFRVFLIKGNLDLHQLGHIFGKSLRWDSDHCFYLSRKQDKGHLCFEEGPYGNPVYGRCITLDDLGTRFDFEYNAGDRWGFSCLRYKRQVELDGDKDFL